MNVEQRQKIEKKIARKFVKVALANGYTISVDNGGDECELENSTDLRKIMAAMFATDEEHLLLTKDGKRVGWVYFVYGNDGWDVIADYTTNLESLMPEVDKLADRYAA